MTHRIVRKAVRYYAAPGAGVLFLALGTVGGFVLIGLIFHPASPLRWLLEALFR